MAEAFVPDGMNLPYSLEAERAVLRREYIDSVLVGLRGHLDNTYLVDEKGIAKLLCFAENGIVIRTRTIVHNEDAGGGQLGQLHQDLTDHADQAADGEDLGVHEETAHFAPPSKQTA